MIVDHALQTAADSGHFHVLPIKQRSIVIVDDSQDDRELLALYLRSFLPEDKPIVHIKSGDDFLRYMADIETEIPEMVFLDLLMPGKDGIETIIEMRKKPFWNDLPVTLVTCSKDNIAIQKAEEVGANAFLPKPFNNQEILEALYKADNFSVNIC